MIRTPVSAYASYRPRRRRTTFGTKPTTQQQPGFTATPAPAQTTPAPTARTPSPAPATGPLPGLRTDSIYDQQLSNIGLGTSNVNLGLTNDLAAAGIQSGIKYDTTPEGQASNFQIDYSNPFSRASLLKKAYEQAATGNTNSMAARGQLYSGALQRQQNETTSGWQQGQHELLSGFGNLASQIFQRRQQALQEAEAAKIAAAEAALGRQQPDPLAAQSVAPGAPGYQPPAPLPQAPALPSGADQLAALGGTLVILGNQRYIRYPDGRLVPLPGSSK